MGLRLGTLILGRKSLWLQDIMGEVPGEPLFLLWASSKTSTPSETYTNWPHTHILKGASVKASTEEPEVTAHRRKGHALHSYCARVSIPLELMAAIRRCQVPGKVPEPRHWLTADAARCAAREGCCHVSLLLDCLFSLWVVSVFLVAGFISGGGEWDGKGYSFLYRCCWQ